MDGAPGARHVIEPHQRLYSQAGEALGWMR
jgi:hypothetical protein